MNVAYDARWGVHLDRAPRANVAVHDTAANDHHGDFDFGEDFGPLADDERVFAADFPFEEAVDPDDTIESELPLERGSTAEERCDLVCLRRRHEPAFSVDHRQMGEVCAAEA